MECCQNREKGVFCRGACVYQILQKSIDVEISPLLRCGHWRNAALTKEMFECIIADLTRSISNIFKQFL